MKNSIIFLLIILIVVAGGLRLYYLESNQPNRELINQDVSSQLLKLDMLDSNINELVLRSRSNLDTNYDMLVRSTSDLDRITSDLSRTYFSEEAIEGSLLSTRFARYSTYAEVKLDQVENFKSFNSVLRNSSKYIPLVGRELANMADQSNLPSIAAMYQRVVIDLQEFTLQGSEKQVEEVSNYHDDILKTEELMPLESRLKVIEFANHVATAIDAKIDTDQYLGNVLTSSSSGLIAEMSAAWNLWRSENSGPQGSLRNFKIAYFSALALLAGLMVFWLRNLYIKLDRQVDLKTAEAQEVYEQLQVAEVKLTQTEKAVEASLAMSSGIENPLKMLSFNLDAVRTKLNKIMPVFAKVSAISDHVDNPNGDSGALSSLLKEQIVAYRRIDSDAKPDSISNLVETAKQDIEKIEGLVQGLST